MTRTRKILLPLATALLLSTAAGSVYAQDAAAKTETAAKPAAKADPTKVLATVNGVNLSVFCHQHLASGEGFGTKSLLHNTVNLGKLCRVETGGFGLLITQADRFGGESRSGKI